MKLPIAIAVLASFVGVVSAEARNGWSADTKGMCYGQFYYSKVQPAWSLAGVPCWKPWAQNPMATYKR